MALLEVLSTLPRHVSVLGHARKEGHHEHCPFHCQNVGHFRHAKRWASFLRDIAHGMPVDKAGQKGKERDTLDAVRVHTVIASALAP